MGDKASSDLTGRLIASFDPRHATRVRTDLRKKAGIKNLLRVEELGQRVSDLHTAPAISIDDLGLAVIHPGRAGADETALRKVEGIQLRPEHKLSRTRVVPGNAGEPPTRLDWLNETTQTWALSALGVRPSDEDGGGISVGVIDSGMALHPDVAGQVRERLSLVPGLDGGDTLGHGTHCGGLIAGSRTPKTGPRYGVAPRASIVSIRVFGGSEDGVGEGSVRAAIYMAVQRGCRVISLAAGRPAPTYSKEDENLGRFLVLHNCILVAAAGNDSDRNGGVVVPTRAPANAPFVPAIGAMTPSTRVWNDSNGIGDDPATRVDALAPGTGIRSAWVGGGTQAVSGTSAATALAAGVVAALWSRNPSLSAPEITRELSRRAKRVPNAPPGAAGDGYLQLG